LVGSWQADARIADIGAAEGCQREPDDAASEHLFSMCGGLRVLKRLARTALASANRAGALLDPVARGHAGAAPGPVFVVGLPRSGTTLVYELMVQAFDVAFLTKIYSYLYGLPNITTRLVAPATRNPKPRYRSVHGRIPGILTPAENHSVWSRWFPERPDLGHFCPAELMQPADALALNGMVDSLSAIARRPYVFKNVYFSMSISALLNVFPGARVLVIRRDDDAIAASLLNAGLERASTDWWSVRPPFYTEWQGRDLSDRVAYQVVRTGQLMDREIDRIASSRCMFLQYEDLCRWPLEAVKTLAEWGGDALVLRRHAEIPEAFPIRAAKDVPDSILGRYREVAEELRATRIEYLGRVDGRVSALLTEALPYGNTGRDA